MHDPRFSLANERTYLAWVRTALALVVAGLVATKAIQFHHEAWRWVVALPPVLAGGTMSIEARRRWTAYERAMRAGDPLPAGRSVGIVSGFVVAYAVIVLVATALDGTG
jgi:putative membrane protein